MLQGEVPLTDHMSANLKLGPFTVTSLIGKGQFSLVWRADAPDGSSIAIKVFNHEFGPWPQDMCHQLISREVSILRQLRHDGVVEFVDGRAYHKPSLLITRFLPGVATMEKRLDHAKTGLGWEAAKEFICSATSTMAWIHAQGVVHGDIRPGHISWEPSGAVFFDFGLAHLQPGSVVNREFRHNHNPTDALDSPVFNHHYSPPQQRTRELLGPTADLYAFAGSMVKLITGACPYPELTVYDLPTVTQFLALQARLRRRTDLPPAIADIIMDCLEFEAGNRPPSAAHILAAITA